MGSDSPEYHKICMGLLRKFRENGHLAQYGRGKLLANLATLAAILEQIILTILGITISGWI